MNALKMAEEIRKNKLAQMKGEIPMSSYGKMKNQERSRKINLGSYPDDKDKDFMFAILCVCGVIFVAAALYFFSRYLSYLVR